MGVLIKAEGVFSAVDQSCRAVFCGVNGSKRRISPSLCADETCIPGRDEFDAITERVREIREDEREKENSI